MKLLIVLSAIFMCGCITNGFKQSYRDQTGGQPLDNLSVIVSNAEPRVNQGSDFATDSRMMSENGYLMLGYSHFNGPLQSKNSAASFAKTLHADVVIIYSKYSNTVTESIPITVPTTQTSYTTAQATAYGSDGWANAFGTGTTTTFGSQTTYFPFSEDRYEQAASFWIKSKPPIFGVHAKEMSDQKRIEIGSNQGLEIDVVIKDSPAFNGDFFRGDIIKKINGNAVGTAGSFNEILENYSGQKIKIEGFRNGKPFKKSVVLNNKPL